MDYLDENYGMDCDNPENYPESKGSVSAQDRRDYDSNGWFEVKNNPLSRVGVYQYKGSSIRDTDGNMPADPDKLYNVYRPEEELSNPEAIDSFKLLPWVDNHAMLGREEVGMTPAERKGVSGVLGEDVYFKDGTLYGNIKVFSEKMAESIKNGKRELSLGYRCKYLKKSGTYQGQPYDYVQIEIRGNHLALVDDGRMGESVHVLDSSDENTGRFNFVCDSRDWESEKMTLEELKQKQAELAAEIEALEAEQKADAADNEPEGLDDEDEGFPEKKADDNTDDTDLLEKILTVVESLDGRLKKLEADKAGETGEDEGDENQDAEDDDDKEDKPSEESSAMDAADVAKMAVKTIDARNAMYSRVKPFVGSFDCSAMDAADVAAYACRKIGLNAAKGQEISALNGYLHGRTAPSKQKTVTAAMDSTDASFIEKQLG